MKNKTVIRLIAILLFFLSLELLSTYVFRENIDDEVYAQIEEYYEE